MIKEEQLILCSALLLMFAMAWLVVARIFLKRYRRRGKKQQYFSAGSVRSPMYEENNLEAPLMEMDQGEVTKQGPTLDAAHMEDTVGSGGTALVKSRVPLALRQLLYYVAAWYYMIGMAVYMTRYAKGKGSDHENYERLLKLGSHLFRVVAWICVAKADAAEYKSPDRSRNSAFIVVYIIIAGLTAVREANYVLKAPAFWALLAHCIYFVVAVNTATTPHKILRVATFDDPPTPEERAVELHEIIGFTWLGDVFRKKLAQTKDEKLNDSDLPRLMMNDRVDTTWPKLRDLIARMKEAQRFKKLTKSQKTLALFQVLVALTRDHFYAAALCRLFYICAGYIQPLALYIILKKFGKDDPLGWASVGMLFFGPILNALLDNLQMFTQRRVATRCRGAIFVLLYDKGARLDLSAGGGRVGDVVALMSADVQNVLTAVAYFHWVWGPILQLIITLTALFWLVSVAAFGALFVMMLNSLGNGRIFKHLTRLNKEFLKSRSKRMELITEMLQGARIIKMLAFEKGIFESVEKRRTTELGVLKKLLDCFVGIFTLINSTPPVMGAATFMLMSAALGRRFDAAEGFTALTLLDNLRFVLLQAPASINYIITGWASLQRIEEFLDAPEVDPKPRGGILAKGAAVVREAEFKWGSPPGSKDKDVAVAAAAKEKKIQKNGGYDEVKTSDIEEVKNCDITGGGDAPVATLRDISVSVKPGSLVVVAGITGGGKSSLLSSLVGEIRRLKGEVSVSGTTAYCPQSAWCQNASIRENICFGSEYDDVRFHRTIQACALEADLDTLPAGDATEVGERGVTLSGGQQQRVALARAVYHDADIYILDDPLSAVDAHVGEHLFEFVVKQTLLSKGKTVILATHQLGVALPFADHIVIMSADGTIATQGTLAEMEQNERGRELLADLAALQSEQSEKKPKKPEKKQPEKKKDDPKGASSPGGATVTPGKKKDGKLVAEEERKAGAPALKVFYLYVSSAGPWFMFGSTLFIAQQPIKYVQASALTHWINRMSKGGQPLGGPAFLYLGWTAAFVCLSLIAVISQNKGALTASKKLHARLAWRVLRCPISWYDRSPVGRVQNRFSTDIQAIDRSVSNAVMFVIRGVISPMVSLYAIGSEVWWLIPAFIPVLACAFSVARNYLYVARDLKRIDSTTKSPVYAHFNESLNGLSTLRAFDGAVGRFTTKFCALVDRTNSAELHLFSGNFWLSVRLNSLGATVTGLTALVLFAQAASGNGLNSAFAGLVLSYAVSFTSSMIMLLRTYTDLEISLNAVERVQEYLDLPIEADLTKPTDQPQWLISTPAEITFDAVTLRYKNQPEPALRSLSMVVKSGESLGVVGRTGAGKSTLLQSLLRLYPLESGRIIIDGIDIGHVGLKTLRGRIAIVPQEPTLFAGTVRYNLDMFNERTDDDLLDALEQSRGGALTKSTSADSLTANMASSQTSLASLASSQGSGDSSPRPSEGVAELSLDYELHEFGTNLSVGERQLVCLARAIARKSRLVLLDEATANVDTKTDHRVQKLLLTGSLSKATRITIAHRLKTIVHCDRICVLSLGQLKELDSPATLLADKNTIFYSMCEASGSIDSLLKAANDPRMGK